MEGERKPVALEWITTIAEMRWRLADARGRGQVIGLVPTMGALHAGHGALIERARAETDCIVVSIFVNSIQFDRRDDYEAYRIDLEHDREFCEARGVDVVFAPPPHEMYPTPPQTFVEVPTVSKYLCGAFRPGHFRGVATVVAKLFNIVAPARAYFGEKDAQQFAVIERMVADLNIPVEIVPVATVRAPDGLALSSRNNRLTPEQRGIAPALYCALETARDRIGGGCVDAAEVKREAVAALDGQPEMRVEYFEVVDPAAMTPVERISGPVRIVAAVWLGTTRLIDNLYCVPGGTKARAGS